MSIEPDARLTVVIPTWNRCDLLRQALDSLSRQTKPCSVLVVDNGSNDETQEMLRLEYPTCRRLILSENQGFARAVNAGIKEITTEFVALLNNDTEADAQWVEAGLEALDTCRDFAFFASRMINFRDRTKLDGAGDCYSRSGLPFKRGLGRPADCFPTREPVLGASAGAAFYRRTLFERVGFFDESFVIYLEDVDLSLRAQLHGLRCLYLPEAIVYHIEAASDPERGRSDPSGVFYSRNRVFWITRNRWSLMLTYQPIRHIPWLLLGWARSFLFHLLKAGQTAAFMRGITAGLACSPTTLSKRLRLKKTRMISTKQLCHLLNRCSPSA